MASWAEDQERSERYDDLLRVEPGFLPEKTAAKDEDDEAWYNEKTPWEGWAE